MDDDWRGFIAVVFTIVVGTSAILGVLILAMAYGAARPSCAATAKVMGIPYHWDLWTDCMLEVQPGQWVPKGALHYNQVTVTK